MSSCAISINAVFLWSNPYWWIFHKNGNKVHHISPKICLVLHFGISGVNVSLGPSRISIYHVNLMQWWYQCCISIISLLRNLPNAYQPASFIILLHLDYESDSMTWLCVWNCVYWRYQTVINVWSLLEFEGYCSCQQVYLKINYLATFGNFDI